MLGDLASKIFFCTNPSRCHLSTRRLKARGSIFLPRISNIITGLSVAVALFVGGLEILQVIANQLKLNGGFWDYCKAFNLNSAGYFIVGAFVVVWSAALLLWKYGKIEERWHNTAHAAQMARGENTDHAAAGIDLGPINDGWKID